MGKTTFYLFEQIAIAMVNADVSGLIDTDIDELESIEQDLIERFGTAHICILEGETEFRRPTYGDTHITGDCLLCTTV